MAKELRNLSGTAVAITGGARGIGAATAQALIQRGCRVAIGDLDLALAQETAERLGGGAVGIELDVTDAASFANFLDAAEREIGDLGVLINNAGIMPLGPFVEETDATSRLMVDVNIHGVILGTRLALLRMLPRRKGHIVNIASQAGKAGLPGGATYSATKHAVVGLTEAVAMEVEGSGVDLSYVMPAVVNTELATGLAETRGIKKLEPSDVAEAIVSALQTGRIDVWVPKSVQPISTLASILPRRARRGLSKMLNVDKTLAQADSAARRDYEQRASEATSSPDRGTKGTAKKKPAEKNSAD